MQYSTPSKVVCISSRVTPQRVTNPVRDGWGRPQIISQQNFLQGAEQPREVA